MKVGRKKNEYAYRIKESTENLMKTHLGFMNKKKSDINEV